MSRDTELDEMERELKAAPYIEQPEKIAIQDGTTCWVNADRACGPDCRAYDPGVRPPEGPEVCSFLGGLMDIVEGMRGFINIGAITRKSVQDKARQAAAEAAVPDPGGRKIP